MRVAVLSDIHANAAALDAVLAAIPSVDEVWQLGDVVGYGPEPDAVVARLRSIGALGVRGNHDAAAMGQLDIDAFNVDARRAMEWTQATIGRRHACLAGSRSPSGSSGEDSLLVHGSPRDPTWEYVTTTPVARAGMAAMPTTNGLHGHTHVPIAFVEDDGRLETMSPGAGSRLTFDGRRVLLNPGSVGQPRDGIPTASWLLLDTESRRGDVAPHRLRRRGRPGGDGGARAARAARRPAVVWTVGPLHPDREAAQAALVGREHTVIADVPYRRSDRIIPDAITIDAPSRTRSSQPSP